VLSVKRAVYAGSFDPVTLGHLSVIERGARLFDELCVVVATNPQKIPMFSSAERALLLARVCAELPSVTVRQTSGYVVELARQIDARYLVRGVRGATDTEAELELARSNHRLAPEIETVFVPAHVELSEVSSSRLKELVRQGADVARYCPSLVAERLRQHLGLGENIHV
jgi:pantetheine-phosphate adenylyltransferase